MFAAAGAAAAGGDSIDDLSAIVGIDGNSVFAKKEISSVSSDSNLISGSESSKDASSTIFATPAMPVSVAVVAAAVVAPPPVAVASPWGYKDQTDGEFLRSYLSLGSETQIY